MNGLGGIVDGVGLTLLGAGVPGVGCDFEGTIPELVCDIDGRKIVESGEPIGARTGHADGGQKRVVRADRDILEYLGWISGIELVATDDKFSGLSLALKEAEFLLKDRGGSRLGDGFDTDASSNDGSNERTATTATSPAHRKNVTRP